MAWSPADGERRKSYCPHCAARGEPTTVSFASATRTFTYKCKECGLEWIVQVAAVSTAVDAE